MRYRQLGRGADAVRVSAIGLGEMPLSLRGRPTEDQALRTIHASLDAGVTLIDTADAYCDEIERKFPAFADVARDRGVSPQQVALAWMLAKGANVIPIPGSSRPETALASAQAADIDLSDDEVARLDAS
jgi:aryl-alcohol dehydrogenase-like predicted oxidoreductase